MRFAQTTKNQEQQTKAIQKELKQETTRNLRGLTNCLHPQEELHNSTITKSEQDYKLIRTKKPFSCFSF